MYKNLEKYLEDIGQYLSLKGGTEEILSEIKSHILEKTEYEFGEITETSVEKIIANYGSSRRVAEKYMEGYQIIAPSLKKHLLLYTGILFVIHFSLTIISLVFQIRTVAFPFFYIPKIDAVETLFYLPMALVFDLGIVGIVLYFVTQWKKPIHLPLPKIFKDDWADAKQKEPKIIYLILMLIAFGSVVVIFIKYQTLFFVTLNFKNLESLLNPKDSIFFSLILIGFFACEVIFYIVRFFIQTEWANLIKNTIFLALFWLILNSPIEITFKDIPGLDLTILSNIVYTVLGIVIILLTIMVAINFLRSLIRIARKTIVHSP